MGIKNKIFKHTHIFAEKNHETYFYLFNKNLLKLLYKKNIDKNIYIKMEELKKLKSQLKAL